MWDYEHLERPVAVGDDVLDGGLGRADVTDIGVCVHGRDLPLGCPFGDTGAVTFREYTVIGKQSHDLTLGRRVNLDNPRGADFITFFR